MKSVTSGPCHILLGYLPTLSLSYYIRVGLRYQVLWARKNNGGSYPLPKAGSPSLTLLRANAEFPHNVRVRHTRKVKESGVHRLGRYVGVSTTVSPFQYGCSWRPLSCFILNVNA